MIKQVLKNKFFYFINYFILSSKKVNFKQFYIKGKINIVNKGHIELGDFFKANSGQKHNPIGGDSALRLSTTSSGSIIIGDNVKISNSAIYSAISVRIEDDVMIGGGCKIYDTDFHSLYLKDRLKEIDPNVISKPIIINKGVFIGAHSIILKGVTIGNSSVVGAGSVVTKSIPEKEIWAGNPAKFIKKITNQ
jgi:acetyltransferase-like isoleucine patch superfamily enzyme